MDTIFIAIIFSVPGIMVSKIYKRLFPKSFEEKSEYEKTIIAIPISTLVLMINIFILNVILNQNIYTITYLLSLLYNFIFLTLYIILTVMSCFIVVFLKRKLFEPITLKLINWYNKKKYNPTESKFSSEWENIFENPEVDVNDMYVSIEKDGKIITQGLLAGYSPPNQKKRDISLIGTKEFKEYLINDRMLDDDKKLFDKIDREYYDFETGILIKIYNNQKIKDYFNNNE